MDTIYSSGILKRLSHCCHHGNNLPFLCSKPWPSLYLVGGNKTEQWWVLLQIIYEQSHETPSLRSTSNLGFVFLSPRHPMRDSQLWFIAKQQTPDAVQMYDKWIRCSSHQSYFCSLKLDHHHHHVSAIKCYLSQLYCCIVKYHTNISSVTVVQHEKTVIKQHVTTFLSRCVVWPLL